MNAARALKEASEIIAESPQALQLRYLQTLQTISAEKNSTIIFPLPIDILSNAVHSNWTACFYVKISCNMFIRATASKTYTKVV